ncbi:hypothetical protein L0P88_04220 [Muricauda sp. SCSIO 64092]|uniref:hypothetical protein n=1 Tax=Allomuricauda sp. SCSIO 64092 TaxID=2908842 RepID=UPI001FF6B072|nr:hypothetical protein [Muricauda sp. SCSIO 64092]UOY07761.1 hypothetical protein L0P88_04220 [Muricauda sp. SCSIO 64092]
MGKEFKEGLLGLIADIYGSPEELAKILDLGVEMLFYLEEDTFERRDVQSVVSALRAVIGIMREPD